MHIKKIEIDGFKSYAQKQVVDRFDLQFNAITGLNGSGKSNILDSICFVLGITDLKCIRAENMNSLVYKSGQAGVNKATVTITFDNRDKKSGPMGYANYDEIIVRRQVIVGGRNSYTINGSAITNGKVSDFFRGVGLNVNNPHFLIMQGRITKVLNMKPNEILGMVEEAAGTKMYETKRLAALNTIEKKQSKVKDIEKLLNEEILPQVERLKQDRENYHEFKKCDRDIDIAKRKLSAFLYTASLKMADDTEKQCCEMKSKIVSFDATLVENEEKEQELAEKLKELENEKAAKNAEGRSEVEEALKVAQEDLVEKEAARDEVTEEMNDCRVELDRKHKSIADDKKELKRKQEDLAKRESEIGGEEQLGNAAEETVRLAKAKLEALAKGLTTDDQGQAVTLEAQITTTRSQLSEIATEVKKAEMKEKRIVPELKKKQKELESLSKQNSSESNELQQREQEVVKCENALKLLKYDEAIYTELQEKIPRLRQESQMIQRKIAEIFQRDTRLDFQYTMPYPEFDRDSEIRGVLATLFRVKDPKYATALETASTGFLFHVVVAHQKTAALMVDRKLVPSRRTFIPLDHIGNTYHANLESRVQLARKVATERGEEIKLAIDLIEFDPEYQKCMEHVFQSILVLEDPKLASDLTFNKSIRLRTVTVRGDDNKPNGNVSGGAIEKRTPLLQYLLPYDNLKKELKSKQDEITKCERLLAQMEPDRVQYIELKNNLDRAKGRLDTIRENLKNSPIQLLREEIENMEKELPECQKVIADSSERMKDLNKKIKEYEDRKKNEKAFQEKEKKTILKELEQAESTLKNLKGSFETAKATLTALRTDVQALQQQITNDEREVDRLEKVLAELNATITEREQNVQKAQSLVAGAQKELDVFLGNLREHDDRIKNVQKKLDATKKATQKAKNEREVMIRDLKKNEQDVDGFRKMAAHEMKKNPWIDDEKGIFGQKGTHYDFTGYNKEKGLAQIQSIDERKKTLEKKLNTKGMNILGHAEEQVMELLKKKEQVNSDRNKLLETIEMLDEKKKREILKAHSQVNRDFGNIFSTLLPGAGAKLEPPKGQTALDGLEVKVSFNGQWKKSLNELSGGQRSLVALSLVLAMLKFKPAPIYILDEVDSALDLSHTQNIGHMIKKHFTNSQFIIVSLKEGMFNHANVLYRTRFVDGTSMVTRTENRP